MQSFSPIYALHITSNVWLAFSLSTVVSFDEQKFIFFIKRCVVRNGGNGEFLINRYEVSVKQDE